MKIRVIKRNEGAKAEEPASSGKPVKTVAGVVKQWVTDVKNNGEAKNRPTFERVFGSPLLPSKLV